MKWMNSFIVFNYKHSIPITICYLVHYPIQFSGSSRSRDIILATHVQHRFAQLNGGSTNTTRVHALCPEYHIYFMVEDWDIEFEHR